MLSLNGALRTCKVDTAYANRLQSDRFENPNIMTCPVWSGRDLTGRVVCENSFMTKTAGCDLASDRVLVENGNRPQYMQYINLDAAGIEGDSVTNMDVWGTKVQTQALQEAVDRGPMWDNVNSGTIQSSCQRARGSTTAYEQAMMQNRALSHGLANPQTASMGLSRASGY